MSAASPRTCPLVLAALLAACADPPGSETDATATAANTDANTASSAASSPTTGADPTGDPTTTTAPTSGPTTADPTTAGPTTDPTTGATTGAPAQGCEGLPLCDDFEGAAPGGPPDAARWSVVSPDCSGTGKLAVSDEQARSGARSVKVEGGGGYCDHVFLAHAAALESLGPVVHGRFFIRLDAALGDGHVTFAAMNDANNNSPLRIGGQAKILMWNRASDDATLPVLSPAGIALSVPLPTQQWACVEFMVDESSGHLQTWVDGVEVAGLHLDSEPTPEIDQQWLNMPGWKPLLTDLKLGWESYAGATMTLYFDDVALSDAPIGCD